MLASSPSNMPASSLSASPPCTMLASPPPRALSAIAVRASPSPSATPAATPPYEVSSVPAFGPVCPPKVSPPGAKLADSPNTPDRLDVHIARATHIYLQSASWGDFIRTMRGQGDVHPDVATLPHPAGGLLAHYGKEGTPASMSGPPWDQRKIAAALQRGPH
eukprot:jgi/Psemu1/58889/gm1.58889_g